MAHSKHHKKLPANAAIRKMAMMLICAVILLGGLVPASPYLGAQTGNQRSSGLPIPRLVSLSASEVNVRVGPGMSYPIKWVFQARGMPLVVIGEYDNWRKVRDWESAEGWVHEAVLSGTRTVIVTTRLVIMRRLPADSAPAIARLASGVIARLEECDQGWCQVKTGQYEGWLKAQDIWGDDINE